MKFKSNCKGENKNRNIRKTVLNKDSIIQIQKSTFCQKLMFLLQKVVLNRGNFGMFVLIVIRTILISALFVLAISERASVFCLLQ